MSIQLKWKSGGNATSHQVWRSTSNVSSGATMIADDVAGLSYEDTSVTVGTTYYYWNKAKNSLGTSGFGPSSGAILARLRAPTEVTATLSSDTEVTISWSAVTGATSYYVQRSATADFSSYTEVGSTSGTSFDDVPGSADTAYYYKVIAKNGSGGTSEMSLVAIGYRAPAIPASASSVVASDDEAGQVTVSWTAAARATAYKIFRHTANDYGASSEVGDSATTSFVDSSVSDGVLYYYWVLARNYTGDGIISLVATGNSLVVPLAPDNINATDEEEDFIEVSWTSSFGADEYKLYRSGINDPDTSALIHTTTTLSYVDLDVVGGTAYYYWVKASNIVGDSPYSISDHGEIAGIPSVPAAPTSVQATTDRPDKVRVSWLTSSLATSYSVWRNTTNTSVGATSLASGITALFYDDTSGTTGTTYYYFTKASNTAGDSAFSTSSAGLKDADGVRGASQSFTTGSYDHTFHISAGGTIDVAYDMDTVADRLEVFNNSGAQVGDTGCVTGTGTLFGVGVTAGNVRIVVTPNCAGGTGSHFAFSIA